MKQGHVMQGAPQAAASVCYPPESVTQVCRMQEKACAPALRRHVGVRTIVSIIQPAGRQLRPA
jgi:hypothetical protein